MEDIAALGMPDKFGSEMLYKVGKDMPTKVSAAISVSFLVTCGKNSSFTSCSFELNSFRMV